MVYHNTVLVRGGHGHTINFGLKCVTYFLWLLQQTKNYELEICKFLVENPLIIKLYQLFLKS